MSHTPTPTAPTLLGVGVGPGDPELITVKAVQQLSQADVILVPSTEKSGESAGRAELIVLANLPQAAAKITRVPFSMADPQGVTPRREAAWRTGADAAITAFRDGATKVAFATIGDPSIYSTFSYLAATVAADVADLQVELTPGITAMQALAAASGTPLVEGTEVLALAPATAGVERLGEVLDSADTVVVYKAGRQLPQVLAALAARDRLGATIVGSNIGLDDQELTPATELDTAELEQHPAPYFSAVLAAPSRNQIGGRL